MPEEITKIQKISDETKEAAKRKSAQTLPDRPSEHGYSAAETKRRFSAFVLDATNSAFGEIDRIVEETNEVFEEIDSKINDLETNTSEALNTKVDKIAGKGLSANDYTTAEKNKLADIEAGAQVNTVTGVKGADEEDYDVGQINITPAKIGLGNVNDTADTNKPVSAPQKTYIDTRDDAIKAEAEEYTDIIAENVLSSAAGYVETEEIRAIAAEVALSQRITAQEGLGGFLDAYNFGVANPSQEALTIEALNQIPSIDGDALKIWNGTRITNLYDNNVWQFNHVPTSTPPYEWANIGSAMIAQATNEILGIVKGSDSVRVNSQGEVYTSVSILGAIPSSKEPEINEAVEKVNNAVANMEATLGLEPLWDAEGENELLDAEEEYLLSVAHIDANSINGREFYVMSKAEHAALIQAGTYIPDAFYLTF